MSTQSTLSKLEKEKLKLIQEKCQTLLNDMLRDEDNKYCVDCDAKGPRWASWNLGIFLCIRCAGIHRNLGVHISRVKSVNLDSWTPEQVLTMQQMGNSRARAVYEANMPDTLRRPQTDTALESFIRAKYEHKKYIAKEWVEPGPVKVNWDAEIEESLRKKKEVKKSGSTDIGQLPAPVSKPPKSSPASSTKIIKTPVIDAQKVAASTAVIENASNGHVVQTTTASDDLFGLITDTQQQSAPKNLFTSSDPGVSNPNDDLGSIFSNDTSSSSIGDVKGKMTKDSILSLYGSAASTPNINPFIQSGGTTFGNINSPQSGVGAFGGTPIQGYPQGQTAYAYNSNQFGQTQNHSLGQHNAFHGLNQLGGMQGFGAQSQQDMNQVQNQLFGLNMGNFPQQGHVQPMAQNALGFGSSQQLPTQQFQQMNNFMSTTAYQPTKADNLPGLGKTVSQLMQPNLSGSSFWK